MSEAGYPSDKAYLGNDRIGQAVPTSARSLDDVFGGNEKIAVDLVGRLTRILVKLRGPFPVDPSNQTEDQVQGLLACGYRTASSLHSCHDLASRIEDSL